MEKLKILVIEKARFSRGPNHLPKSIRVLKWRDYPESSLPAHYDPKTLVNGPFYIRRSKNHGIDSLFVF
jgi:hypothetical protein